MVITLFSMGICKSICDGFVAQIIAICCRKVLALIFEKNTI